MWEEAWGRSVQNVKCGLSMNTCKLTAGQGPQAVTLRKCYQACTF